MDLALGYNLCGNVAGPRSSGPSYLTPIYYNDFAYGIGNITFTASRGASNPATYVGSDGLLYQTTTSDVPRYTSKYYDETGLNDYSQQGVYIESQASNLFVSGAIDSNYAVNGNNFERSGTARWNTITVGGSANLAVSTDSKTDFGGRSLEIEVTNAGSSTFDVGFFNANQVNLSATTDYTISFWLWSDSNKTLEIKRPARNPFIEKMTINEKAEKAEKEGIYRLHVIWKGKKDNKSISFGIDRFSVGTEFGGEEREEVTIKCGKCGKADKFKIIDKENHLFQCINCGSFNQPDKAGEQYFL